jgi:hypothetical protein
VTAPAAPPTVVWEYVGRTEICQLDSSCLAPARWVVQTGDSGPVRHPFFYWKGPWHHLACDEHRPVPQ